PAAVKSIDAVGAGDAFCGALATWWAGVHEAIRKRDPNEFRLVEEAAIAASVAGSLATTKHGAIPSMPERSEVIAAMSGLKCS
ncbi:MAG: PfkB family carbohydrate kinase, partial [Phycisphaerales bacterium]